MTRYGRSDAILISGIFGVGLLLATIGLLYSEAHAQSADLVLCDRLAADPADPEKPADVKGTRDVERSDIATAIKFSRSHLQPRGGRFSNLAAHMPLINNCLKPSPPTARPPKKGVRRLWSNLA
jgi:hypothetical protein